jgi:hypothetical protein
VHGDEEEEEVESDELEEELDAYPSESQGEIGEVGTSGDGPRWCVQSFLGLLDLLTGYGLWR